MTFRTSAHKATHLANTSEHFLSLSKPAAPRASCVTSNCSISFVKLVTTLSHDLYVLHQIPRRSRQTICLEPKLEMLQDDDRICGQAASVKSNKLRSMRVRKMGPFVAELNKHLCSLKDSSSRKDNRFVQNSTPDLTIQIYSILQRLVDAIPLLLSQSHADVIVKGICCPFEGRNPSNPSTKRESNKNGQFLVAYHNRGDHLCF